MDGLGGSRLELRHLRAFETVARLSSFTYAAGELNITQPALSRTVAQLEDVLGVTLLERTSRHVGLTVAGRSFLDHVQRMLVELDLGLSTVRSRAAVRLGFSWLLPDPWAQTTVARFERSTSVPVTLIRTDDALGALKQGKVDAAVVRGRVTAEDLRAVHLFDERRVAVCSINSAVAQRPSIDWSEIPQSVLVVNVVSGTTGPWSWPAGDGPRTVVETANFDEWLESVAADRGIGVITDVAARRNVHSGVRFIPLRGAPPSPVLLVFLPRSSNAALRRFVEISVACARECEPCSAAVLVDEHE